MENIQISTVQDLKKYVRSIGLTPELMTETGLDAEEIRTVTKSCVNRRRISDLKGHIRDAVAQDDARKVKDKEVLKHAYAGFIQTVKDLNYYISASGVTDTLKEYMGIRNGDTILKLTKEIPEKEKIDGFRNREDIEDMLEEISKKRILNESAQISTVEGLRKCLRRNGLTRELIAGVGLDAEDIRTITESCVNWRRISDLKGHIQDAVAQDNALKKKVKDEKLLAQAYAGFIRNVKELNHYITVSGVTDVLKEYMGIEDGDAIVRITKEALRTEKIDRFRNRKDLEVVFKELSEEREIRLKEVEEAIRNSRYDEFDDEYDDGFYEPRYRRGDSQYEKIVDNDNPGLITTVSLLRHHVNCHGISGRLLEHFGMTGKQMRYVIDHAKGETPTGELRRDPETFIANLEEEEDARAKAEEKNARLVEQAEELKDTFCGMGIRKTKLLLNKYVKGGNPAAAALRAALEAEHLNVTAKKTPYPYKDKVYAQKERFLSDLIAICRENGYVCGRQDSDNHSASNVLYFELPHCRQISFHCADGIVCRDVPEYVGEWDGEVNSTLPKLEAAIRALFGTAPVPEVKTEKPDFNIYAAANRRGFNFHAAAACQIVEGKKKGEPFLEMYGEPENREPELNIIGKALTTLPEGAGVKIHSCSKYILTVLRNMEPYPDETELAAIKRTVEERGLRLSFMNHGTESLCMQPVRKLCGEQTLRKIPESKQTI